MTVSIMGISPVNVGHDLVNELKDIYPDGSDRPSFSAPRVDESDPRIQKVLQVLESKGMKPWVDTSKERDHKCEYMFSRARIYEPEDFEGVELLRLYPADTTPAGYRTDGVIELRKEQFNKSATIAAAEAGWYVVPDRIKNLIEQSDLIGPTFRPTRLITSYHTSKEYHDYAQEIGETWWELTSEIVMPPLSERLRLTDSSGRELLDRHDFSNGVIPREGAYAAPEFRYTRISIDEMSDFDLAKTYERMGTLPEYDQRILIASRRFEDFCKLHNIKTDWHPIRIDETEAE